jgi:hypothetical protein
MVGSRRKRRLAERKLEKMEEIWSSSTCVRVRFLCIEPYMETKLSKARAHGETPTGFSRAKL